MRTVRKADDLFQAIYDGSGTMPTSGKGDTYHYAALNGYVDITTDAATQIAVVEEAINRVIQRTAKQKGVSRDQLEELLLLRSHL